MSMRTSLREWAKENKVWEPKTWRIFLEKDLVPFYKQAYTLNALHEFLKSEKICGKSSLADIEDETLKNKIRVAIYGGVEPNKDFSTSFAKFMYDNFGICAENAPSFEESIKHYESWGDGIKVSINPNSWVNSIPIGNLVDELKSLIQRFCDKLNIKLSEISIQESYPYHPFKVIEPDTLLPQAGEKPEKLVSLINEFKQKALDLSIGVNPFTTFVFYSRTIPLVALMRFFDLNEDDSSDVEKIAKLANFLGLKAYSMIDQREVSLPTKSPDKVILLLTSNSLSYKILELRDYLEKINPTIKQVHENMIKQAINQIYITFEPWKDYEPIFSAIRDIMKDEYGCELVVSQGRIEKITNGYSRGYWKYREIELHSKIWLRDFLIKISPIVSAGIVRFSYSMTQLEFHPLAKEWIDKVIENEGKA
ncbi:hypothetical protein AIOGIFDO_00693 [Candidatus Methanoperedenaceae archaeon GB37]|nr:hypothetical protein AIOGIFDO_00693 [Candidatus Methanoperedenaceae archaeon GB37]